MRCSINDSSFRYSAPFRESCLLYTSTLTDADLKPRTGRYARICSTTREQYKAAGGRDEVGDSGSDRRLAWLDTVRRLYRRAMKSDRNELMIAWAKAKDVYKRQVNTKRNLLNHADEGRFVQQSYYGEADGSKWDGKDWVWNPIQGGGWRGQKPEILSQNITSSSLEIVSVPVHWASGKLLTECQMEEKITLDGDVAHIHYTFRNTGAGATDHPATEQEVPALSLIHI